MKVFLGQINPTVGDLDGNAKKIFDISHKASRSSADIVITPELSLWGYPAKDLLLKKNLIKKQNQLLDFLAKSIYENFGDLDVLIGIAEEINDSFFPNLYNSTALLSKGKWAIVARKIILPTYEVFDEKRYFRSGKNISSIKKSVSDKEWNIGITICEDLWVNQNIDGRGIHKKNPISEFQYENLDLLLNLSASPYTFNKLERRKKVSLFAARKLKIPLIYINQVGGNDDLIFDGNSFSIDENGKGLNQLKGFEEDSSCIDLNKKNINLIQSKPKNNLSSIFEALVLGLKDYTKKCGFKSVLIGLSGGIDSALVTTIATAALGNDNVFCISMPSPWSTEHSIIDAKELVKRLNINFEMMPIHNLMNSYENTLIDNLNCKPTGVTSENIQSRIRGTLLMALANQKKHLLLSTGNKSELAVGYCTLYGDMNGGLSVIGDLYKTNVFKLCRWIDSEDSIKTRPKYKLKFNEKIIGDNISNKPPSAELGPDQLDSDSLPPYSELDAILKGIIEERKEVSQLEQEGHKKDLIIKILKLIKASEFKRRQAPPILKISDQSLGYDWRIPIAISY